MRHHILIAFISLILELSASGQAKPNCFEIKYLDFFGVEKMDTLKWPASELDQLLLTDFTKDVERRTNFLIPFILLQLKDYYPTCSKQVDTSTYRKLTQLYSEIRQQDFSKLSGQSISAQLEFIKEDFYEQVQNDSLLPFMSYTFDDGPFYGQLSKYIPNYKKGQSYKMDFGSLFITKYSGKVFITVLSNQGNHLWTRIMTGNSNRLLPEISFSENDISKTSLGYQLRMFSDGEVLNLYLKSNGEFRYYFHSW
ncbi:MAG: hypothetical protein Q7T20_14050 [Saprospiraceae bacterium]|nr:hypothetical protein [Saprospiraceae bacterium]